MTDRNTVYRGLSHAAWGYLFLNLDFNLGSVSILPRFVGYLLFFSAIEALKGERRDLALLRPLAIVMALWCGGDWLLSWVGGDIDGRFLPLDLLMSVIAIYFQFQFLTDMAALAKAGREPEGADLDRRLRRLRTVETVLVTLLSFLGYVPKALEGVREGLVVVLGIAYVLAGLWLMIALFALRQIYQPFPLPPEEI